MNIPHETKSAPGWGSVRSPVAIVGQSLCEPCMESKEPFDGGCGIFLGRSLDAVGIDKCDLFITNVVHCHPRDNCKSRAQEKKNCRPYLLGELEIVQPRLVIGLGGDAEVALRSAYPEGRVLSWPFKKHRPIPKAASSPDLLFAPHPGRIRWLRKDIRDRYVTQWVASLASALEWGFRDRPNAAL
ncbi:uracil-DNA glycosylase family protein [Mycobacterium sp. E735]|uniref:uracil-DNA glycosylase family protein n=1 Tax=Mycobacterium sp. E735 TaxID=1834148 RepID=UPI0009EF307F|nr:uracil-DNA glycosylase family protein [Mycobacterium sp. E735]